MLIRCKDYENSQKGGGGLGKACVVYYYEKLVDPNTRSERYVCTHIYTGDTSKPLKLCLEEKPRKSVNITGICTQKGKPVIKFLPEEKCGHFPKRPFDPNENV